MALTYDFTNIENYQEKCTYKIKKEDADYDPNQDLYKNTDLAESLIWMCLFIGMNQITEKNYEQFYNRTRILEATTGAYRNYGKYDENGKRIGVEAKYFTKDEIKSMIGLRTNATKLTKAEFYKSKIKDLI